MRDALLFNRWTTAAQWLLLAAAAYSGALAVNRAVAFWLDTGADPLLRQSERGNARAGRFAESRARDYSLIFERDLFGDQPAPVAAPSGDTPSAPAGALDLRLRGTAQVDEMGYAVIEDAAAARQEVFAVGEKVFDGPMLIAVHPAEAVIEIDGRKQTLTIAKAEPEDRDEPRGGKGDKEAGGDGIRKTGTNSYLVDRREVEHSVDNLNELATQLRAVPYLKDGAAIGFRLFNIRRDSVFDRMGLKNGDVIQKVNGVELDSPTKALALLEDVQTTDEIRVDLLRGDTPSTMTYTVR